MQGLVFEDKKFLEIYMRGSATICEKCLCIISAKLSKYNSICRYFDALIFVHGTLCTWFMQLQNGSDCVIILDIYCQIFHRCGHREDFFWKAHKKQTTTMPETVRNPTFYGTIFQDRIGTSNIIYIKHFVARANKYPV